LTTANREHSHTPRPQVAEIQATPWENFAVPKVGDRVDRFLLTELLGQGGYGYVWKATDTSSDRSVAIKIFNAEKFRNGTDCVAAAQRFHDGAAAMRRLEGQPEVVRIVDGPHLHGAILWFAMEVYPERDLGTWLERYRFDPDQVIQIINDVLSALEAARREGIVHRDVRPGNILVNTVSGEPRGVLADFDIAYYDDRLRTRETTTEVLGVRRYLVPEVFGASSSELAKIQRRPANDLYALAVVILDAFSTAELSIPPNPKEARQNLRLARAERAGLDPGRASKLLQFLAKALSKEQPERFAHINEFHREWDYVASKSKLFALHWVGIFGSALALLVIGDWLFFDSAPMWRRILGGLLGGLGAIGGLGVGGAALGGYLKSSGFRWGTMFSSRITAQPVLWSMTIGALLLVLCPLALKTDPLTRLRTTRVNGINGCVFVDESDSAIEFLFSDATLVDVARVAEIRCPERSQVTTERRSLFGWIPAIRRGDPVSVAARNVRVRAANQIEAFSNIWTLRSTSPFAHQGAEGSRGLVGMPDPFCDHARLVWNSTDPPGHAGLLCNGSDLGLKLVRSGLLDVAREGEVPPEYSKAAADAKAESSGGWGEIATRDREKARLERLAACPAQCCRGGEMCEDMTDCAARWACRTCRGDLDELRWKLRLENLDLVSGISVDPSVEWHNVKVCLTTGNRCGQQCVLAAEMGSPLGEPLCEYTSQDLHRLHIQVIGVREGIPHEQIVAQAKHSLKLTGKTTCSGIVIRPFESRNGHVRSVHFSIHPRE
jgi:hypothetical protein